MTTECFDADPCVDSGYTFSLGTIDGGDTAYLLSDIAGERPMNEVEALDTPDQRAFVSKVQNGAVGLVSLYGDGRAHYTQHSLDYSVRYSGQCEARS